MPKISRPIVRPTARKRLTAVLASAVTAGLLLAGCASTSPGATSPAKTPTPASGGFPVTIDTVYGDLTLNQKPERIVALDDTTANVLLALGETPEAYFAAMDDDTLKNFPWLEQHFDRNDPALRNADWSPAPETIAAHRPDLIVSDSAQITEPRFQRLSSIAPVYAGEIPSGIRVDWRTAIVDLGALTGKTEQANQVTAGLDDLIAESRAELPGLQGKTFNVIELYDNQISFNSGSTMESLGLVPAEGQPATIIGGEITLAMERLEELRGDVLIVLDWDGSAKPLLEADPRFAQLTASKNGSVLFLDAAPAVALTVPAPLSLRWLIEDDGFINRLAATPLNKN